MRHLLSVMSAIALTFGMGMLQAATVDPDSLKRMRDAVNEEGEVRVMITLRHQKLEKLSQEQKNDNFKKDADAIRALKAELGNAAFTEGSWESESGQIGVYIKAAGISILQNSQNALAFTIDPTDKSRITAMDLDGSLTALRKVLRTRSEVDAEIILDTQSAKYQLLQDGSTRITNVGEVIIEANSLIEKIRENLQKSGHSESTLILDNALPIKITTSINKKKLLLLQNHPDVRGIRPIGYQDPRTTYWSAGASDIAEKEGQVEVSISLRGGLLFSPDLNWNSRGGKNQAMANREAMTKILADANIKMPQSDPVGDSIGSFQMILTKDQLSRLRAKNDPRILELRENRPLGVSQLQRSMPTINMPVAWASGNKGSGVAIAVLDDGIRKTHEMFLFNGTTKVVGEDCFGSNSGGFKSICPNKDLFGDSPAGTPNAGEPNSDLIGCQLIDQQRCGHGTLMASVAAGRASPNVASGILQGVAPDAQLISINIFSYDRINNKKTYYLNDLEKGLSSVLLRAGGTTPTSPAALVVNLSIGTVASYPSDCDANVSIAIRNLIRQLRTAGVPVIASTGNYQIQTALSHPACSEYSIKAASVLNDEIGYTLATKSNIAALSQYTYPIFLAPGGDENAIGVNGAGRVSDTDLLAGWGTSLAAAHISGFAAVYKSTNPTHSVDQFIAWVNSTGSVPVSSTIASGVQTWRRIAFP